jgi:hypothetical protein
MERYPLGDARHELRTQFLAVLSASRELDPEVDGELADVFIDHVDAVYGYRSPQPQSSHLRRFAGPLIAGIALLAFLIGASIPLGGGDELIYPAHMPPGYGEHHIRHGRVWQGPPFLPGSRPEPHTNV